MRANPGTPGRGYPGLCARHGLGTELPAATLRRDLGFGLVPQRRWRGLLDACGLPHHRSAVYRRVSGSRLCLCARLRGRWRADPVSQRRRGSDLDAPTLTFTTPLDLLTVSPVDPEVLIGADFDQVFRSADGGATWIQAPFGTRFFGKPVFDRSRLTPCISDTGRGCCAAQMAARTWQDSNTGREFTALIASPFAANEALGGDDAASWRIVSSGDWWSAAWWDAPLPFQALWRSVSDARVLYARSETGFWRYVPTSVSWSIPHSCRPSSGTGRVRHSRKLPSGRLSG